MARSCSFLIVFFCLTLSPRPTSTGICKPWILWPKWLQNVVSAGKYILAGKYLEPDYDEKRLEEPIHFIYVPPSGNWSRFQYFNKSTAVPQAMLRVTKPLFMITAGWRCQSYGSPIWEDTQIWSVVRDAARKEAYHVIVPDWTEVSAQPYPDAVRKMPRVAEIIAQMVLILRMENVIPKSGNVFVGHSLGAHLASMISTQLQDWLVLEKDIVYGLDPANPFVSERPMAIHATAGQKVIIFHTTPTNASGVLLFGQYGMQKAAGTHDVYIDPSYYCHWRKNLSQINSYFDEVDIDECTHSYAWLVYRTFLDDPDNMDYCEIQFLEHDGSCYTGNVAAADVRPGVIFAKLRSFFCNFGQVYCNNWIGQ